MKSVTKPAARPPASVAEVICWGNCWGNLNDHEDRSQDFKEGYQKALSEVFDLLNALPGSDWIETWQAQRWGYADRPVLSVKRGSEAKGR